MYYSPGPGRPGPIQRLAEINQDVLLQHDGQWYKYRIQAWEAIQSSNPLIVDFGAINAGATDADNDLQIPLEMGNFEIGQFRMKCLDDIRAIVYSPRQTARFGLRRALSRVSLLSRISDPWAYMTEFSYYGYNAHPFMDVINPTDYNLVIARIGFWGYHYRTDQIGGPWPLGQLQTIPGPYTAVLGEAMVRGGSEG